VNTTRYVQWSLETWPVKELATLIRHDLDQDKINDLVVSAKQGNKLPPIFVLLDGPTRTILDGHHRVAAWVALGQPTAQVLIARPQ
jgi:ParB-like chromosome segregation protein Spo0J